MQKISDINQGDIIIFKAADNNFKVLICTSVYLDKSPQYFTFAALTYDRKEKPTRQDILSECFFGTVTKTNDLFNYTDLQLEKMWRLYSDLKPNVLGSYGFIIWRKDLMKFRDNLEILTNVQIVDNLDKNGNGSLNASDWNFLQVFFNQKIKSILVDRGQQTYKISAIIKDN
jgi:hypothetical protein